MTRDPTVVASMVLFAVSWGLLYVLEMPVDMSSWQAFGFRMLQWIFVACVIRATVLWFQTMIHAIKSGKVFWVLCQAIFVPFASYIYYFVTKEKKSKALLRESERRAHKQAPVDHSLKPASAHRSAKER